MVPISAQTLLKQRLSAVFALLLLCVPVAARPQGRNDQLMDAIRARDTEQVRTLLHSGADPNAKDRNGKTPLVQAVLEGFFQVIPLLLENGAEVNSHANDGMTPLFWAASLGDVKTVRVLLNKGADVNARNNSGWTPIMSAASLGHAETVRSLLEKHADISVKDKNGNTALLLAEKYKYNAVAAMLKNPSASAAAKTTSNSNSQGGSKSKPVGKAEAASKTPAPAPSAKEEAKPAVVAPADPPAKPVLTESEVLNRKLIQAASAGDSAAVLQLIRQGAGVNAKDPSFGRTALTSAAVRGHTEVVRALLKKGGEADEPDNAGQTALMLASYEGFTDTVGVLLQNGANVNARDKEGLTPLFWATFSRRTDTARFLLENGADVNARNKYEDTALIQSAYQGDTGTVAVLLEHKADINAKDDMGRTALIEASRQGHVATVRLLLEKGADASLETNDKNTALSLAEQQNFAEVVAVLKNPPSKTVEVAKEIPKPAGDTAGVTTVSSDPNAGTTQASDKRSRLHVFFRTGAGIRQMEDWASQPTEGTTHAAAAIRGELKDLNAPEDLLQLSEDVSKVSALPKKERDAQLSAKLQQLRNRLNVLSLDHPDEQLFYTAGTLTYDFRRLGQELSMEEPDQNRINDRRNKSYLFATIITSQCSAMPECSAQALPYFQIAAATLEKSKLDASDGAQLIDVADRITAALGQ